MCNWIESFLNVLKTRQELLCKYINKVRLSQERVSSVSTFYSVCVCVWKRSKKLWQKISNIPHGTTQHAHRQWFLPTSEIWRRTIHLVQMQRFLCTPQWCTLPVEFLLKRDESQERYKVGRESVMNALWIVSSHPRFTVKNLYVALTIRKDRANGVETSTIMTYYHRTAH